jgi:hypothetical protein
MRRDGHTQQAIRILNMQEVTASTPPLCRDTILDTGTKVLASWSLVQAHPTPIGRTESNLVGKTEQRY